MEEFLKNDQTTEDDEKPVLFTRFKMSREMLGNLYYVTKILEERSQKLLRNDSDTENDSPKKKKSKKKGKKRKKSKKEIKDDTKDDPNTKEDTK